MALEFPSPMNANSESPPPAMTLLSPVPMNANASHALVRLPLTSTALAPFATMEAPGTPRNSKSPVSLLHVPVLTFAACLAPLLVTGAAGAFGTPGTAARCVDDEPAPAQAVSPAMHSEAATVKPAERECTAAPQRNAAR